jgi:polysaccharide pyruvyl transferase CsaB
MTRIVISGYYGFGNAGDEAMLAALLDSLTGTIAGVDITVITGNCALTQANHHVKTVNRLNFWGIFWALLRSDLLISGGGSLLQDVTSSRSLYYYLAVIKMAQFLFCPVMLYAQGIGPIQRPFARRLVRHILEQVALISVRDEESKMELESMGVVTPVVEVTADAVLAMNPVDTAIGQHILKQYNIMSIRPKIGISVRDWKNRSRYKDEIAKAADCLHREWDADIVFIPMQYPDDVQTALYIQSLMETTPYILNERYSTSELMAVTGCMNVLLGIRLHALIFASVMKVPVAAISYDPKIDRFMDLIGEPLCGTLDTVTTEMLVDDIGRKLSLGHVGENVMGRMTRLRELSLRNARLALQIIEKKNKH